MPIPMAVEAIQDENELALRKASTSCVLSMDSCSRNQPSDEQVFVRIRYAAKELSLDQADWFALWLRYLSDVAQ